MKEADYIQITPQDVEKGFSTILRIDNDIIPNLVDITGKPSKIGDYERLVLISTALLALSPNAEKDANGNVKIKLYLKEAAAVVKHLEKVMEGWDSILALGGIVSLIRNDQLSDYVK